MQLQQLPRQKRTLHQQQVFALHLTLLNQKDLSHFLEKKLRENPFILSQTLPHSNRYFYFRQSIKTTTLPTPPLSTNWREDLQHEIRCMPYNEKTLILIQCLIDALDERGIFLSPNLSAIQKEYNFANASLNRWQSALQKLQLFGEPGFASFSVERFLLRRADYAVQNRILTQEDWSLLQELQISKLSPFLHKLQFSKSYPQHCEIISFITRELPHTFNLRQSTYIQPDATILFSNNQLQTKLLGITARSITLKHPTHTLNTTRKLLWERALSIVQALSFRHKTLFRVVSALMHHHKRYWVYQSQHPKALTQEALAQKLNLATSTLSRTIHEKYIQTPRGTLALKNLFPHAVTATNQTHVSHFRFEELLRKIIQQEPSHTPYSDKKIQEILLQQWDLSIGRRTITKYRLLLGIPNSYQRKFTQS